MSERESWMPSAVKIQTAMAGGWPSVEREIRAAVEKAVAEVKADWENAIQHERMLLADDPRYAQDAVIVALKARHAHEIEKAKLEARIEAMDEWGPCDCHQTRVDCPCCKQIKKLRAALAALEVGK